MATPARPVDPFAGPSLSQRTAATSPYATPGQGFQQNGPQVFSPASLSSRTTMTGLAGFGAPASYGAPTTRIVAGVRPESQYRYNMRRAELGRAPVIPTQLDPLTAGAQYLLAR